MACGQRLWHEARRNMRTANTLLSMWWLILYLDLIRAMGWPHNWLDTTGGSVWDSFQTRSIFELANWIMNCKWVSFNLMYRAREGGYLEVRFYPLADCWDISLVLSWDWNLFHQSCLFTGLKLILKWNHWLSWVSTSSIANKGTSQSPESCEPGT